VIADLDDTLKQLLIQRTPLDPVQVDINFEVPDREWSAGLAKPTLNLYLYDIRENLELRETHWETELQEGRGVGHRHAPVRIDLAYLITAWTRAIEDEHRLLWQALSTCCRYPLLPAELLQGGLKGQQRPVRLSAARGDGALKDPADFWAALDNQPKPSVNLVVTLELDTEMTTTAPPVTEVRVSVDSFERAARQRKGALIEEEALPGSGTAARNGEKRCRRPGVQGEEVVRNHRPPEVNPH